MGQDTDEKTIKCVVWSIRAIAETMMAKYYASTSAVRAAGDAVQLHGANGVSDRYPVARYYRDAKIMEIIEGSTAGRGHP